MLYWFVDGAQVGLAFVFPITCENLSCILNEKLRFERFNVSRFMNVHSWDTLKTKFVKLVRGKSVPKFRQTLILTKSIQIKTYLPFIGWSFKV